MKGQMNMYIRYIKFKNDDNWYTTANELGNYLLSKDVKFRTFGGDNSYHFGTVFNDRLIEGLIKYTGSDNTVLSYDVEDFPKLLSNYNKNAELIQRLINLQMCDVNTVHPLNKGSIIKAIDLYSFKAVIALLNSYDVSIIQKEHKLLHTFNMNPSLCKNNKAGLFKKESKCSQLERKLFV